MRGELPCTRDEASTLAGIQLHIEEAWPEEEDEHLPNEQDGAETRENEHLLTSGRVEWKQNERKRKEIYTNNRLDALYGVRLFKFL